MDRPFSTISDAGGERLRSGQACLGCRKRKNRCDGGRPECGFCKKRKLDCKYGATYRPEQAKDSYVSSLEEKVRRLERDLSASTSHVDAQPATTPPLSSGGVDGDLNMGETGTMHLLPAQPADEGPLEDIDASAYDSDGQLEIGPGSLDVQQYDHASVHDALADFGLTACASSSKRHRSASEARSEIFPRKRRVAGVIRGRADLDPDVYVLPPRSLANTLVDLFFEHVFPLHPFVHEPTFRKLFNETYEKKCEMPIPWQSTLNLIFAFGSDYLDLPLDQSYELSQTFHRRGAELILSVCFDTSTVEVVQALLLLSGHLQSNMQFNRVWISLGCIVRAAQGLGLHLDPTNWKISSVEKELRKRLWWGIYALDRFVSLKHGRPPAVIAESLPVGPPETVDDDCITTDGIKVLQGDRGVKSPSPIHFFNAMVQLAHITETMLVSTFRDTPWCLPGGAQGLRESHEPDSLHLNIQIGLVIEQEGKLTAWLAGLPEHLKFDGDEVDERVKRQRNMLHVRYLHTRLMSHRQNLLSLIRRDSERTKKLDDKFLKTVVMASVQQCVECACDIVSLVSQSAGSKDMGAWWYNVQFVFTALGTLFAVQSRASISSDIDAEALNTAIDTALEYLHLIGDVSPIATRCRRYFESMRTWAEDKRSPLDKAILHNMQIPAAARTAPTTHLSAMDTSKFADELGREAALEEPSSFMANSLDEMLLDASSDLFFEPLLPNLNVDFFDVG